MRIAILSAAWLVLIVSPAQAILFCSEPSEPWCTNSFGAFRDGYEYEDCRREVEDYAEETEDYISCLNEEIQAALDAYNDAVDDFNRRVNGF